MKLEVVMLVVSFDHNVLMLLFMMLLHVFNLVVCMSLSTNLLL